jgi:cytochrome c553
MTPMPTNGRFVWRGRISGLTRWRELLLLICLAALPISIGSADTSSERILLPIEVLGANGTTVSQSVMVETEQARSARFLWLQVHGLRYPQQGSVQVNDDSWIPLNNNTATITGPAKSFGGIGGAFATLVMTLPLRDGTVVSGPNTIRFRFNRTDGLSSGYRVLGFNFLTGEGKKILPPDDFAEDTPETWTPPLPDAASIQAGRELWQSASLAASGLPASPKILAHCADCHAQDGRDLKYFNFSNYSIVARSRFHGLSEVQGEQIASYIRSLTVPNPGRPWNPPYQPGPGLDEQPISSWAAGAGLAWALDRDTDALPYLLGKAGPARPGDAQDLEELAGGVTPEMFRPDGDLNARQVPIGLQLPDWSQWLPRVHPKDAWGKEFTKSEFAALYGGENQEKVGKADTRTLRGLLQTAGTTENNAPRVATAFAQWSQARGEFLKRLVNKKTEWSPGLTNKVYSTQLWQLVKTWEMMQEFGLEERGSDFFGPGAESRTWFNTVPGDAAPSATHIPDGPAGVGGSALTNQYASASWYELQILLNSGNHRHRDRAPVDWVYVIAGFHQLYDQTGQPEPVRLLVAVVKALQSTDPRLGPDDLRQGWRPEQNVDPRIMISPLWAPIFKPLPVEVHRALTASLLAAWMDKNLQYPIVKYLPLGLSRRAYTPKGTYKYGEISGGNAWEAAQQFRDAGVAPELVERLRQWGVVFTDRAARIQY